MEGQDINALLQKVGNGSNDDGQQLLQQQINHLIQHDFARLVQLLYRMDVDEKRLKILLQQQPQRDAAETIATLLIERQLQKKNGQQPPESNPAPDDAERW